MKYIKLILLLIIIFSSSCDLNKEEQIKYSNNLDSLRNQSTPFLKNLDSENFLKNNNVYLKKALIQKDSFYIGDAFWMFATFYKKNNQIDSTFKYYNKSIQIYTQSNNHKKVSQLLYNLANLQWVYMDYAGAESNLFNSLDLLDNDYEQEILNYNLLGIIYLKTKEFNLSIKYFKKALSLIKLQKEYEILYYSIYNNLGYLYKVTKDFSKSLEYYLNSEKYLEKDNQEKVAKHINNINYVKFLNSGPSKEIEDNLKNALILRLENNYKSGICDSYLNLTKYYLQLGKDSLSLDYAQKGLSLSKEIKYHENQLEFYTLLSRLNPNSTENYLISSNTLRDSIEKNERKIRDGFSRIKYETDQYKSSANKLESTNSYLKIIIGLILIVLILLILFFIQKSKNRKIIFKRELEKEKTYLYKLSALSHKKLEKVKKEERLRIAMDLHDGVLSSLASIRISLSLNKNAENEFDYKNNSIIDYKTEIKKIENSIRNISHDLSNDDLYNQSNYLNLLKNTFETTENLKVSIIETDEIYWDDVSDIIKINLFRVFQECYRNTLIHSNGTKFNMTFSYNMNTLIVIIKDDGIGINVKNKYNGIGLSNMIRRIQKILKGTIEINSNNNGTSIIIKLTPIYNEL